MTTPVLDVRVEEGVATIGIRPIREAIQHSPDSDVHFELGRQLRRLARDEELRVVVVTGTDPDEFLVPPATEQYDADTVGRRFSSGAMLQRIVGGTIETMQSVVELDVPVIARVNGDAIGFGLAVALSCDFVVVRKGSKLVDMHMAAGTIARTGGEPVGPPRAVVPGDGTAQILAALLPAPLAKRSTLLCEELEPSHLAALGVVYAVVDGDALDSEVAGLVARLAAQPKHLVTWTKRLHNRPLARTLGELMDLGVGYEMASLSLLSQQS